VSSLRGHHLICLHFFKGEGYDTAFVENLGRVIDSTAREGVVVHSGADDVCHACPHLAGGGCNYMADNEEEIKRLDAIALKLLNLEAGDKADWEALRKTLPRIFPEWKTRACGKCDWLRTCSTTDLWKNLDYG